MTVEIVEVINNTNGVLHYQNTKSDVSFTINPKTHMASDSDGWMPKSVYRDDEVPFKSSGKAIKIWIDDGPKMEISDSSWQFSVLGPSEYVGHKREVKTGSLSSGDKYIVKVDPDLGKAARLTFFKYEANKFQTTDAGQVISNTLLSTAPAIGQAILDTIL